MRNLNIKVGSTWLDVPSGTSIKMRLINNIFYDNVSKRSHSLQVTLPASPTNNSTLGWLNEIGTSSRVNEFNCSIYDGNSHLHDGLLQVRKTAGGYMCNVLIDHGVTEAAGNNVSIRDMPAMQAPFPTPPGGDYPTNDAFRAYAMMIGLNDHPQVTPRRMAYHYGSDISFLFLFPVIKAAMTYCGWQGDNMTGSFMTDTELQQLHFMNTWDHSTSALYSGGLPDLTISEMFESLRVMFNTGTFYNNKNKTVKIQLLKDLIGTTPIDWSDKVPRKSVERLWGKEVVDGVTLKWSDQFYQAYEREDFSNWSFSAWKDNDTFMDAAPGSDGELWKIRTENTGFAWHKPSWWFAEPVNWWPVGYLGSVVDVSTEEIVGEYADFASLPAASSYTNQLALVEDENWYYRSDGTNWNKYTYNNYQHIAGNGKRILTSKISSPIADRIGDELEVQNLRTCPVINKFGTDYAVAEGAARTHIKNMPAMLSFNRGAGVDSQGNTHQIGNSTPYHSNLSTPDIYDYDFNQVGNYRLCWGTDNGLYKTFHEPWFNYVDNGQEVTFYANLDINDLTNLDLAVPIYVHGMKGFIRELEYEIPLVSPVKVTMVKEA